MPLPTTLQEPKTLTCNHGLAIPLEKKAYIHTWHVVIACNLYQKALYLYFVDRCIISRMGLDALGQGKLQNRVKDCSKVNLLFVGIPGRTCLRTGAKLSHTSINSCSL